MSHDLAADPNRPERIPLRRTIRLFRRIVVPFLLRYRKQLVIGGSLMVALVLLQLPLPLLTRFIIDDILPSKDMSMLLLVVIGLAGFGVVGAASGVAHRYLLTVARERTVRDIELHVVRQVQDLPLEFFDNVTPGRLLSRITNDTMGIAGLLGDTLVMFLVDFLTFIVGLVVIFLFHWKLTLLCLALLPLLVLSLTSFRKPMQRTAHEMEARIGESTSVLSESLDGIRIVKAYRMEGERSENLRQKLESSARAVIRYMNLSSISGSVTGLVGSFGPLLVFGYGGYEVMQGHMTLGTLIAFNAFLGYVFGPTQRLFSMHGQVETTATALDRLDELLRLKKEGELRPAPVSVPRPPLEDASAGSVELAAVTFSYNTRTVAISDLSLAVGGR